MISSKTLHGIPLLLGIVIISVFSSVSIRAQTETPSPTPAAIEVKSESLVLSLCSDSLKSTLTGRSLSAKCTVSLKTLLKDPSQLNSFEFEPADPAKLKIESGNLIPVGLGSTFLNIKGVADSNFEPKEIKIQIVALKLQLVIESSIDADAVILPNYPITLQAKLFDANGQAIPGVGFDWEVVDSAGKPVDPGSVTYTKLTGGSALGVSLFQEPKQSESSITFKVSYSENGPDLISATKTVQLQASHEVIGFKPLKIELKIIDERTAKDFFGHPTAKEYFVVEVRLFNNITKNDAGFVGDPILVYGSSLEAMVSFEYKDPATGKFLPATEILSGATDTKSGTPDPNQQMSIAPTNLRFATGLVIPQRMINTKGSVCVKNVPQEHFVLPYRPLEFQTAINTHDRRDDRSTRNRVLSILNGVGSLASLVTSVWVPGALSSIPLGLDKYNNLGIPGFEKLFPSLREVHRQNVVNKAMLPFEEIPFGGEVVKYLFFPKKEIRGYVVVAGTAKPVDIRITGINGSDSCAVVAVIKKIE